MSLMYPYNPEKMSMTKQSSSKSGPSKVQRAAVTGISGAVILVIILIAQLVGVNVLNENTSNNGNAPVVEPGGNTGNVPSGSMVAIPGGYDGGWFQLYFTQPTSSDSFQGAPVENALITALNGAQQSIDAALYEMNSKPITDALIAAKQRGINVRVVTDGDAGMDAPDTTITKLELQNIPVTSDGSRGAQMHDKFVVIDQLYVWTGSTNLTHNGIYKQNNNAILIRSNKLAQNYTTEFEELFKGEFGKTSPNNTPNPDITIDGTEIETIFESEGDVPKRLSELIANAKSVRFLAFSFTDSMDWSDASGSHSVMDQLISQYQSSGLDLKGIVETTSRQYVKPMVCAGMDVRQSGNSLGFMHDKVFIIDGSIVVTGSFNFSASAANSNDENVLIIHNTGIGNAYLKEFDQIWAQAVPVPSGTFSCS
jgi:phosphatidylserine/phosphatidylglycerophosphate/cardiolipin synthase-like enzyme